MGADQLDPAVANTAVFLDVDHEDALSLGAPAVKDWPRRAWQMATGPFDPAGSQLIGMVTVASRRAN
jgi:hypothetical protein